MAKYTTKAPNKKAVQEKNKIQETASKLKENANHENIDP